MLHPSLDADGSGREVIREQHPRAAPLLLAGAAVMR
jgi:hypothetical protein